jgi:hypothetical protein
MVSPNDLWHQGWVKNRITLEYSHKIAQQYNGVIKGTHAARGLMHAIMFVFELPPSESCAVRKRTERLCQDCVDTYIISAT